MRWLFLFLILGNFTCYSQKEKIYLFPGQGADERLFSELDIDSTYFEIVHVVYPEPLKKEALKEYALRIIDQIDTTNDFFLIGVSFGGMLACEIADIKKPKALILISSAKNREELPAQYRVQKFIPIYRLLSGKALLWGAKKLQAIVEPDSKNKKSIFESMLSEKTPHYMKWSIHMICTWNKSSLPESYLHIHGEEDNTIPIRRIENSVSISNGSHMICLTKAKEINPLITAYINQNIEE